MLEGLYCFNINKYLLLKFHEFVKSCIGSNVSVSRFNPYVHCYTMYIVWVNVLTQYRTGFEKQHTVEKSPIWKHTVEKNYIIYVAWDKMQPSIDSIRSWIWTALWCFQPPHFPTVKQLNLARGLYKGYICLLACFNMVRCSK